MSTSNVEELRNHQRHRLFKYVPVNEGIPIRGGVLFDLSTGGAAVVYPDGVDANGVPLEIGDVLPMKLGAHTSLPAQVVRIFEGGFAIKFDFSVNLASRYDVVA